MKIQYNLIMICLLIISIDVPMTLSLGQPFERPIQTRSLPTSTGRDFLGEVHDFRLNYFDVSTIEANSKNGIVSLLRLGFAVTRESERRSTNDWGNVRSVLSGLRLLDRTIPLPQIRVIKRDSIFQSSIDRSQGPRSGFSESFLNIELGGGDIVIIAAIQD